MTRIGTPIALAAVLAVTALLADARIVLRWAEEFKPCAANDTLCVNGGIDLRRWGFELGDGTSYGPSLIGWGNWQRQCHTNSSANARVIPNPTKAGDGLLVIQGGHTPGRTCYNANAAPSVTDYTSARLVTRNKATFKWKGTPTNSTPIRIDVRFKVPLVNGTWPAAWMLPETSKPWCMGCGPYGDGWCLGGEMDIMEHTNTRPMIIGNVHYGGRKEASWENCNEAIQTYRTSNTRIQNFNLMTLIWEPTKLTFLANNALVGSLNNTQWFTGGVSKQTNPYAPFDVPFYLILDLALGGLYPGFNLDNAAIAAGKAAFYVDYIRVYDIVP